MDCEVRVSDERAGGATIAHLSLKALSIRSTSTSRWNADASLESNWSNSKSDGVLDLDCLDVSVMVSRQATRALGVERSRRQVTCYLQRSKSRNCRSSPTCSRHQARPGCCPLDRLIPSLRASTKLVNDSMQPGIAISSCIALRPYAFWDLFIRIIHLLYLDCLGGRCDLCGRPALSHVLRSDGVRWYPLHHFYVVRSFRPLSTCTCRGSATDSCAFQRRSFGNTTLEILSPAKIRRRIAWRI